MKIALVHMRHRGTGGTERYLDQVAAYLAERGHPVTIVCRSHERALHRAVRFVVMRPFALGASWRMWAFARAVEEHVRASSYDVVLGLGRTWTHDVIRLGGGCHQTYLDLARNAPPESRPRWPGADVLHHRMVLAIERRAVAPGACARVITNSEMVKRDVIQRHGVPADKVAVIYNGVDLERFHPRLRARSGSALRRARGLEAEDFVVLFLGTGYGRKGLHHVLEAFPELLRQRPRARLLVVGYDSAQSRYQRQAERLGITSVVRFLGGRRDAESCFAAADLYVLPTYYDPFANSTLEALAGGLPVVTTANNGASELLEHGVTGSVLHSPPATGELLRELLHWSDAGRAEAARPAARALAERFGQERTAQATFLILEAVYVEKRKAGVVGHGLAQAAGATDRAGARLLTESSK